MTKDFVIQLLNSIRFIVTYMGSLIGVDEYTPSTQGFHDKLLDISLVNL